MRDYLSAREIDAMGEAEQPSRLLRVYLDTADIMYIADGKAPVASVDRLRRALAAAPAAIVWSTNHPWDYYPTTDEATKDRFIDAMNQFPLVVGSYTEPQQFEPYPDGPPIDIELAHIPDLREVMDHPAASEALGPVGAVVEQVYEAEQAGLEALRATRGVPLYGKNHEFFLQILITITRGQNATTVDEAIAFWEARGLQIDPTARDVVRAQLESYGEMLRQLRAQFPELQNDATVTASLRNALRAALDPDMHERAPGLYAQALLRKRKRANLDRNSRRSDMVDLMHVQFLPYVDVFTTDRENESILRPELPRIRKERASVLLRTRQLEAIADEIERLASVGPAVTPTSTESETP
jgi:hypothetical protein